jgi:sialate O-acetylesterase
MKIFVKATLLLSCCLLAATVARAEISLAPIFGDHMVLQRDAPLPVWGEAAPSAQITVQFAGQTKTAVAASDGSWKVVFDRLPASAEGRVLTVTNGDDTATINDILVGEVWLCAGQSNMEFRLKSDAFTQTALAQADIPDLRLNLWRYGTQWIFNRPFSPAEVATLAPEKFYTNSWAASSAQSAAEFSAIGWYVGRELQRKLGVPVGVISLAAGGSPTEAWIRRDALASQPALFGMTRGNWLENPLFDDWVKLRGHQNLDKPLADGVMVPSSPFSDLGPNHPFKPAMLWEAGIARIIPFAVRGVLWYQGESNSLELWRERQHEQLFPLLVRDWRAQWGEGDFPFYWVQLSGISDKGYKSQYWPEFRDSQRRFAQMLPNTGFAVSSDKGAQNDVHPTNKRDVAARLARVALAQTYSENIEYSGPAPQSLRRDGSTLVVTFTHANGLRTSEGQAVRGFEIAGTDGIFHPASVKIEGATVVLSSTGVLVPQQVHYAWQPFPDANLINDDELPTSTFTISLP